MVNPAETNLVVQAAVKNSANNTVFYFSIPVVLESLMVPGAPMDVQSLVTAWKSIEDALEVSVVVNGLLFLFDYLTQF